jgi:DNA-binding Xre family transcriptional regulator
VKWNLRIRAAERGIWKSAQMRRMLAEAGLEISAGKMSSWWAGTPATMKLEELDVLCSVLKCAPTDLMSPEPEKVTARRPRVAGTANGDDQGDGAGHGATSPVVTPRFGKPRSEPPL